MSSSQASQLYRLVERGAQVFDRIAQEMQQYDIDGELADAAYIIAKSGSAIFA